MRAVNLKINILNIILDRLILFSSYSFWFSHFGRKFTFSISNRLHDFLIFWLLSSENVISKIIFIWCRWSSLNLSNRFWMVVFVMLFGGFAWLLNLLLISWFIFLFDFSLSLFLRKLSWLWDSLWLFSGSFLNLSNWLSWSFRVLCDIFMLSSLLWLLIFFLIMLLMMFVMMMVFMFLFGFLFR